MVASGRRRSSGAETRAESVIGLFDSGVGGLSILLAIREQLPGTSLVYVADSAWFPYGQRRPAEIRERARQITRFLTHAGARLIVVACNSASNAAIVSLRAEFPLPFVGVEPAVKVAAERGPAGRIGVLCTAVTAQGERYQTLVERVAGDQEVVTVASARLAALVERGEEDGPAARRIIAEEVQPLLEAEVGTIVLGCTHYPFLAGTIRQLTGLPVLEPSAAVARQAARLWREQVPPGDEPHPGRIALYATGDPDALRRFCQRHGIPGEVRPLDLG